MSMSVQRCYFVCVRTYRCLTRQIPLLFTLHLDGIPPTLATGCDKPQQIRAGSHVDN